MVRFRWFSLLLLVVLDLAGSIHARAPLHPRMPSALSFLYLFDNHRNSLPPIFHLPLNIQLARLRYYIHDLSDIFKLRLSSPEILLHHMTEQEFNTYMESVFAKFKNPELETIRALPSTDPLVDPTSRTQENLQAWRAAVDAEWLETLKNVEV